MKAQLAARNPKVDTTTKSKSFTLYIEYRSADKFKRIPTGLRVGARYWDNTTKRIKANGTINVERDNKNLTAHLDTVNASLRDFHSLHGRWPTCDELGTLLETIATPTPSEAKKPSLTLVTQALSTYIDSQVDWQPLTKKSHLTLLNIIREYEQVTNAVWQMETLSNELVTDWQSWLMKKKNYKNSTLGKQVKKLKQFLKDSPGAAPAIDINKLRPIHEMKVSSAIVTLMAKEIAQLYRLDLVSNPRLERVRDLFVLQCYTGLRHSDVIRLCQADISGGFIRLETQKTVKETNIPLFAQAQAILEKYDYNLAPLAISTQKQNLNLKKLMALPSTLEAIPTLKREVKLPEERGTVRKYPTVPLYTVVSSHHARKSFITACLEAGQPAHIVKEFSGHKTDSSFARYVNAAQGQVAAAAALQNAFDAL